MPLVARGRTLGAMTLFTLASESGRRMNRADFALAEEVARRAGIAIDNARLFAEAQRTAAELRIANQAKDEFLGLVSHELRTPITTIFGNAQVLHYRGSRLDADTRDQAVADIEQESERLHRIIDNMLALSRLEAGREIETEPVVVDRMVERIVTSFRQRQKYRTIEIDNEPGLQPVAAEPVYFEQVLRNLLSNADKYSPPTEPVLVADAPRRRLHHDQRPRPRPGRRGRGRRQDLPGVLPFTAHVGPGVGRGDRPRSLQAVDRSTGRPHLGAAA